MAILPDIDIFMWPLSKKYPILRHHGITHTIVFIFCSATIMFVIYAFHANFWSLKLLVIMYLGGYSHLFADFLTNWGVPLLYPVSKKHFKLNIETAVNIIMIIYFIIATLLLQFAREHKYNLEIWSLSYYIGYGYIAYFGLRICIKLGLRIPKKNHGFSAVPSMNPFKWRLAKRVETENEIIITVRQKGKDTEYNIPKKKVDRIEKDEDIVAYTYHHPEINPYMLMYKFPYYTVKKDKNGLEISWRAVELPIHLTGAKYDGKKLTIDSYW